MTEDDTIDGMRLRRLWPIALLALSLSGLALFTALNADRLCGRLAPAMCGGESSALRIPLSAAAPGPASEPSAVTEAPQSAPIVTDPIADETIATEPGTFATQFANIADPQATGRTNAPRISRQIPARLQDVTFDLGAGADSASTIEVRKTVRVNGADVGTLAVRIDESARLYANGSQLSSLLPPDSVKPAAAADQFLSFDQLRGAGVNIRYDPTQDKLVVADK